MFIEVGSDKTVDGKGEARKGAGKGGNFQGKGKGGESHDEEGEEGGPDKPSEPPPGACQRNRLRCWYKLIVCLSTIRRLALLVGSCIQQLREKLELLKTNVKLKIENYYKYL